MSRSSASIFPPTLPNNHEINIVIWPFKKDICPKHYQNHTTHPLLNQPTKLKNHGPPPWFTPSSAKEALAPPCLADPSPPPPSAVASGRAIPAAAVFLDWRGGKDLFTKCGWQGMGGFSKQLKRFMDSKSYDIDDFTKLQVFEIRQDSLQRLRFFSFVFTGSSLSWSKMDENSRSPSKMSQKTQTTLNPEVTTSLSQAKRKPTKGLKEPVNILQGANCYFVYTPKFEIAPQKS